uniref:Uncharacterized protein n=1 Tax=Rhizophora mucronata TaxID=61149 RepID=A0A2P2P6E8_RHIMU
MWIETLIKDSSTYFHHISRTQKRMSDSMLQQKLVRKTMMTQTLSYKSRSNKEIANKHSTF